MGRGMIPVPSVPIRIGFLLLVLVVIIHDLVVSVVILTALGIAALLAAHVGTGLGTAHLSMMMNTLRMTGAVWCRCVITSI